MSTETIWTEFNERLLIFIKTKVSDEAQAKDLLQDVFVKIHLKLDSLDNEERLTSWLYQITRNAIIDFYKKRKLPQTELDFDFNISEEVDDNYNERFFNCVAPFVDQLEPTYRDALKQTNYGSSSQKEFAKKEGISYTAAKSRIQRARKKLKDEFLNCCRYESDKYGNIIGVNPNCNHC
ncbi:MAG: RNA polymerase sigma factor SigZ [Reichenbachiella sp.]